VGVFELTSCEGCLLQLANKEDTLVEFLRAADFVAFRELSSAPRQRCQVALVEGAVTTDEQLDLVRSLRAEARVLAAVGSCACFGGVAQLKSAEPQATVCARVYGDAVVESGPARPLSAVVPVDVAVPGCPVAKDEIERLLRHLVLDVPFEATQYPVCVECKQRYTACTFDRGELCLGAITRAGCGAPCPAGGLGCWGCRGPAPEASLEAFHLTCRDHGLDAKLVNERLAFYGGFGVQP
jgi:sulfhydrogenase subunit delta